MNPRIVAGIAKNKKLKVGQTSRPFTDRIKQSVFDLLGIRVENAKTLDLFAGPGSLGLEALSRGAKSCLFVEQNQQALELLKENIDKTGFQNQAKSSGQQVRKFLSTKTKETFDLIFIDPPFAEAYKFKLEDVIDILAEQGIIVFRQSEEDPTIEIPKSLGLLHSQKYGSSLILFIGRVLKQ